MNKLAFYQGYIDKNATDALKSAISGNPTEGQTGAVNYGGAIGSPSSTENIPRQIADTQKQKVEATSPLTVAKNTLSPTKSKMSTSIPIPKRKGPSMFQQFNYAGGKPSNKIQPIPPNPYPQQNQYASNR